VDVGLDYLTLGRSAGSLSGGEAQRIRLATQIGSRLMGVLYVLDEPSIGLHPRDNARLLATLRNLRDLGNSVLVVEHDEETIALRGLDPRPGPGRGRARRRVVAEGPLESIPGQPRIAHRRVSLAPLMVPIPEQRRLGNGKHLKVVGAKANNLKNLDVRSAGQAGVHHRRFWLGQIDADGGYPLQPAGARAERRAHPVGRARAHRGHRTAG
jgi:excinuclease ABC subunit A